MNIAKFKPAIVYTIYIAATAVKVWQAPPERMLAAVKEMGIATP
jgi:hypothetical protein